MRILQINAVNGLRSTGRQTEQLAEYLDSLGHESFIAYANGTDNPRSFKIGNTLDYKVHAISSRITGKQGYFSRRSTQKLLTWMTTVKPDIVLLGNLHNNYINLEMLFSFVSQNNIPTVLVLHDCWFYTGKCTHYTVDNCYKWKGNCGSCPRLKKDNISWLFDRTSLMLSDKRKWYQWIKKLAVVGVSDWITNEARQSVLASADVITRIYNWIDLKHFRPVDSKRIRNDLNIQEKFVILGVASDWSNAKGLDQFIWLANHIDDDEIILLVGNVQKGIVLPSNIKHIPETHHIEELVEIYSMANVLINLSREESFGKVVAESLACGTPVITNRSTANPELVDTQCGIVCDSIQEVFGAISEMKTNGKTYFHKECVRFAQNHFNSTERMNDYIQLFDRILGVESKV